MKFETRDSETHPMPPPDALFCHFPNSAIGLVAPRSIFMKENRITASVKLPDKPSAPILNHVQETLAFELAI